MGAGGTAADGPGADGPVADCLAAAGGVDGAVQATAYLAAACRAAETRAPHPRLRDEYAERFVRARPADQPSLRSLLDAGGDEVVARTVLLDELLRRELAAGDPPVVVNLGAGCCTRPYRLDLSGCQLVLELDAEPVLALKAELLADERPSCPVWRVAADLRDQPALAALLTAHCGGAGRVVVVSEGLLPYLPAEAVATLAATLAGALGDPVWLTDLVSGESARQMAQLARTAGARVELFGLATLAPFEQAGWVVADYRILPVARRGPVGARGPGGTGRASHRVVDGVAALHRRRPGS